MRKKTHEEYVVELTIKNPTVEVIGRYVDSKTKIEHHCLLHDVYWDVQPSNALNGQGCEMCRREKISNFHCKTTKEYILEVESINPSIIVLEEYIDAKTPILHKCVKHNIEWKISPTNVLQGQGCVECRSEKISEKVRKTHEQYILEVSFINQNIVVLDRYIDANTPILHKCLVDGYEWFAQPNNILSGFGCPKCSQRFRRNHNDYVNEVSVANSDVEVIEEFKGLQTPILHRCKIDGYEWKAYPEFILKGCGCPQCQESSGERQVRQWLERYNITYKYQMPFDDCVDKKPLPFDFYLPNHNICIEYDGKQHYESIELFGGEEKFKLQQYHDQIKNEYCENNNIKLLRIPYFKNVEEELNNFLFI